MSEHLTTPSAAYEHNEPYSPISYPIAPLWRRLLAMLYESLLVIAVLMAYGFAAAGLSALVHGKGDMDYQITNSGLLYQAGIILSVVGFYTFFWYRAGQTVGMRAWRLRVKALHGGKLELWRCAFRALIAIPGFLILGISYWWKLIDAQSLCLHDRLSGTKVVLEPKQKK